jgi:hypothetical protein
VLEGKPKLPREILITSLTVGGGYGFLTGRHGLTIDNLVGATVVIADGRVLKVNKDENQDVSSYPVPNTIRHIQYKRDMRSVSTYKVTADKLALLCNPRWRIKLRYRHQLSVHPSPHPTHLLVRGVILYRG